MGEKDLLTLFSLFHFFHIFFKTHVLLIGSFHLTHIFFFTGLQSIRLFFKNIQIILLPHTHKKKSDSVF